MAAAYNTGTASSPQDLLQTLVAWLVTQGWTQDASASDGSGWRAHLHKNSQYVNFRAAMNELPIFADSYNSGLAGYGIGFYLGSGYSGASAWNAQAGGPIGYSTHLVGVAMSLPAGSIAAYHFFDDGSDNIAVVVEKVAGQFVHLCWGRSMQKIGFSADYWYFSGSTPSEWVCGGPTGAAGIDGPAGCPLSHAAQFSDSPRTTGFVRVDAAVYSSRWCAISANPYEYANTGRDVRSSVISFGYIGNRSEHPNYDGLFYQQGSVSRMISAAFGRALLLPIHCYVQQTTARWAPVGYPPSLFFCEAAGHGYAPSSILAVGGLNYMVFPHFAVRKAA